LTLTCGVTPGSGVAPLSARFSANPEGGTGTYAYAWAFGDGGTASVASPTHVYSTVANYAATLRVTSGGQTADCTAQVSVTSTPPAQVRLQVGTQGGGTGSITSAPAGISCAGSCEATFAAGTVVTVTATPDTGSVFAGWSGDCNGTRTCSVTMDSPRSVQARFEKPLYTLRVTKTPLGSILGSVSSNPGGINCTTLCPAASATFPAGTTVTLRASAILTALFQGWGGACSGTGDCVVTMNADTDVTANFNLIGFAPPGDTSPTSAPAPSGLFVRSLLTSPGARGDVTVDGRPVIVGTSGDSSVVIDAAAGTLLVEGFVRQGSTPGSWRFDFGAGRLAPGAIGVMSGEVVELTADSIAFRVKGRAGERVAFTLRNDRRDAR
jgi:PKD repeat protein